MRFSTAVVFGMVLASGSHAQPAGSVVESDFANAYHYVDHYEVMIDAPPQEVWPKLLDFASWMHEFDMEHQSGPETAPGAVYRIYEGQDLLFEVVKVIPEKMILGVNLPSMLEGEASVGMSMITLAEFDGQTLVTNFMSRQYEWHQQEPNPSKSRRESADFKEFNQRVWDNFFARLKELVER